MSEQTESFAARLQARVNEIPVGARGTLIGMVVYLLAFACTYALVTIDTGLDVDATSEAAFTESGVLQQSAGIDFGFPQPEPSTFEFVGWILYNAHSVEIIFTPEVPTPNGEGGTAPEAINVLSTASTQIPELVYHLVPVLLLTVGGYGLARQADITGYREAIKTGLSLPLGYVPLAVIGMVLATTSATSEQGGVEVTVSASPSLILGVIATLGISALFGTVGVYLGWSGS